MREAGASYWMDRARTEEERASRAGARGQIAHHRDQARRFLDLAFAEARRSSRA